MKTLLHTCILSAIFLPTISAAGNPATFWSDYPTCEDNCHQSVYAAQDCSLANSCSCSGCLCLADSCLCETSSWLIAVAQCIGEECGSAAVTNAASIAASACAGAGYPLAVPSASLVSVGLAALPQQTTAVVQESSATSFLTGVATTTAVVNSVESTVTPTVVVTTSVPTVTSSISKSDASVTTPVNAASSTSSQGQASNVPVASTSSGLSTGAKAGIGIGAALAATLVLLLIGFIVRQKRENNKLREKVTTGPKGSQSGPQGPHELSGAGSGAAGAQMHHDSGALEHAPVSPVWPTKFAVASQEKQFSAGVTEALSPEEKRELEGRRRAAELSGTGRDIPVAPAGSERMELEARRRVFELP